MIWLWYSDMRTICTRDTGKESTAKILVWWVLKAKLWKRNQHYNKHTPQKKNKSKCKSKHLLGFGPTATGISIHPLFSPPVWKFTHISTMNKKYSISKFHFRIKSPAFSTAIKASESMIPDLPTFLMLGRLRSKNAIVHCAGYICY